MSNALAVQDHHAALGLKQGDAVFLEVKGPGQLQISTEDPTPPQPQRWMRSDGEHHDEVGALPVEICRPMRRLNAVRVGQSEGCLPPSTCIATPRRTSAGSGRLTRGSQYTPCRSSTTRTTPARRASGDRRTSRSTRWTRRPPEVPQPLVRNVPSAASTSKHGPNVAKALVHLPGAAAPVLVLYTAGGCVTVCP
jgi:hypothetical protein